MRFRKTFIAEGLVLILLTGCATVGNNGRNVKNVKNETKKEEVKSNKIVVETPFPYRGHTYRLRLVVPENARYIEGWLDEEYVRIPFSKKFKKFKVTQLIVGNPSLMIVGIDEKGNYGFMLIDSIIRRYKMTPILTELPAKKLEVLGIKMEIKYDEERSVWITQYYNKQRKLFGYDVYDKDGKELENKDLGLCEFIECKRVNN